MKKRIYFFLAVFISLPIFAQDITGTWNGALRIQGIQLRIVFHIEKSDNGFSSTMDSPDQGAKGIVCETTTFENPNIAIDLKNIGAKYEGILQNDSIVGTFSQLGMKLPLNLSRNEVIKQVQYRPQEPKPPFPYYSEDVRFVNEIDGDTLAGTLTLPKKEGKFPVIVMITGSGAQNRDEELMGHKPFLVIADFLTRNGIGVLRYDDRGTASSTGNFKTATTFDLSKDAESAVNYLLTRKNINRKKIGLIGHSEGGMIAPMVAARNKQVAYIILLAGTGMRGDELLMMQSLAIAKTSGTNDADLENVKKINAGAYDLINKVADTEKLKIDLKEYFEKVFKENAGSKNIMPEEQKEAQIKMMTEQLLSPWMQYFIKYDPIPVLKKVNCPVLALNGSKDLQVPANENLSAIKRALETAGNKNVKIVELPGLNHLFQMCVTGLPAEYAQIEQTFSPDALNVILNWLKIQVK